jgi:hypothetical protein
MKPGIFKIGKRILIFSILIGKSIAYGEVLIPLSDLLNGNGNFLDPGVVKALSMTLGVVMNHRPYEPATPLGTHPGVDFGIDVGLMQVPPMLGDSLAAKGFDVPMPPVLPSASMLNVHKGLTDSIDIGGSILTFKGFLVWSIDAKWVFLSSEEGLTWALRVGRTSVHIPVGSKTILNTDISLSLDTVTVTPELVVSKKLEFADPYAGIGVRFVSGAVNIANTAGIDIPGLKSASATGTSPFGFMGLSLRVPLIGFRLTLEGSYSPDGFNSLGTKIGFNF